MSQERNTSSSGHNRGCGSKKKQCAVSRSLENYNIRLLQTVDVDTCPEGLREIFQLIHNTRKLEIEHLGRKSPSQVSTDPDVRSMLDYEKKLIRDAFRLARRCSDPQRPDDHESKWVSILEPLVFSRFNRESQELKDLITGE